MTKTEKEELKIRCNKIVVQTSAREVRGLSSEHVYEVLKNIGKENKIPILKASRWRARRDKNIVPVFKVYLNYLIEESLKYPIDIYIPHVGILKIREIDSVGRKALWNDNGVIRTRNDTPFDTTVMYRIYSEIFTTESMDFTTRFFLRRRFIKPILRKIYLNHPEGGYYTKYIKKKD